jgi:hypothetical protein
MKIKSDIGQGKLHLIETSTDHLQNVTRSEVLHGPRTGKPCSRELEYTE